MLGNRGHDAGVDERDAWVRHFVGLDDGPFLLGIPPFLFPHACRCMLFPLGRVNFGPLGARNNALGFVLAPLPLIFFAFGFFALKKN
jgi:hypothetical protein